MAIYRKYPPDQLKKLTRLLKASHCPGCGQKGAPLSGYKRYWVTSRWLVCRFGFENFILCPACAKQYQQGMAHRTLFVGLWSPAGLLLVPYAFMLNWRERYRGDRRSEEVIYDFLIDHKEDLIDDPAPESKLAELLMVYHEEWYHRSFFDVTSLSRYSDYELDHSHAHYRRHFNRDPEFWGRTKDLKP